MLRLGKGSPRLRRELAALARECKARGTVAYVVGGCVRDLVLGRPTKDLDVVAESDPEPLARLCARRLGTQAEAFDRFGTWRVRGLGGLRIDFVRARAESYPAPAALPVVRPAGLADDLARRDFSINAMAAVLGPAGLGDIVDPLGGLRDLRHRRLRVLHARSFQDDPTRLYRAARFACRFGFRLDAETERLRREAVAAKLPVLLSRERLRGELWRVLEESDPRGVLALARRWGLVEHWSPDFAWPPDLHRAQDPLERLILVALRMGPERGEDLVRSLRLERPQAQAALAALDSARSRASPRETLPPAALRALRRVFQARPAAFRPLFLNGNDLKACGLEPGPRFSEWLGRAARAQWSGSFSSRAGALRWLRRSLPRDALSGP